LFLACCARNGEANRHDHEWLTIQRTCIAVKCAYAETDHAMHILAEGVLRALRDVMYVRNTRLLDYALGEVSHELHSAELAAVRAAAEIHCHFVSDATSPAAALDDWLSEPASWAATSRVVTIRGLDFHADAVASSAFLRDAADNGIKFNITAGAGGMFG
jgi:hypothetical protein